jgi:hypothetical protein
MTNLEPKIRDRIITLIDSNFSAVMEDNLKEILENHNSQLYEYFIEPQWTKEDVINEHGYSEEEYKEFSEDELQDIQQEMSNSHNDLMWSTLFNVNSEYERELILKNSQDIIKKANLIIIDIEDFLNTHKLNVYSTGLFIGFNGCGYDFYSAHWKPLFEILGYNIIRT